MRLKSSWHIYHEFNEGKEESHPLGLLVTKEQLKDKTKLYILRPIRKPSWEDVDTYFFSLEYFGLSN